MPKRRGSPGLCPLDEAVHEMQGAAHFATIDFPNAYWQLPLDPVSWEDQCYLIKSGFYLLTRTAQGFSGSAPNFQ